METGATPVLRSFPARQNGLEMRRLFFRSHDADFNFFETGGFEPAVQIAFGETQPAVAVKFTRFVKIMFQQIQNQYLALRLQ